MKNRNFLAIMILLSVILITGCQNNAPNPVAETPNTMPPSIMVDGEIYSTTGIQMPIEPVESTIKTVSSVIKGTELPSSDGEINFPIPDTQYAKINDREIYIVVLIDLDWVKFERSNSH